MNSTRVGGCWRAIAAAVRGSSHERIGLPCQDAFALRETSDGIVAVVCDGAGSARLSHLGSSVVSAAVADYLCDDAVGPLDRNLIFDAATTAIDSAIMHNGGVPYDYGCTIHGLRISGDKVESFSLGDGLVAAGVAGEVLTLHHPQRGEYANATYLVPHLGALDRMELSERRLSGLNRTYALFTDGLLPVFYQRKSGDVSQVIEQIASNLDDNDIQQVASGVEAMIVDKLARKTSDDCTLVVIRRIAGAGELLPPKCPSCARWVMRAKRAGLRRKYTCDSCGCEHWSRWFEF